jgi:ribonuclease HI
MEPLLRKVFGAGVVLVSLTQETIALSYKLELKDTNNVAEYEALVLGLRAAKNKGIEEISIFGDAKLIFRQVRNLYQYKHPRLRSYRNEAWDLIDNFFLPFIYSRESWSESLCHQSSSMM